VLKSLVLYLPLYVLVHVYPDDVNILCEILKNEKCKLHGLCRESILEITVRCIYAWSQFCRENRNKIA